MSDPLLESLPWLDLARKLFPAGRYLAVKRQVRRLVRYREAAEAMQRGTVRLAQTCALHGCPQDIEGLEGGQPLWCGCEWLRDVIYPRGGKPQRVVRVIRRDPVTGTRRAVTFADTGAYPDEDVLNQVREALGLPGPVPPR